MRDVTGNVSVCDINGVILIGWPSVTQTVIIALDNWFRSSQITGLDIVHFRSPDSILDTFLKGKNERKHVSSVESVHYEVLRLLWCC